MRGVQLSIVCFLLITTGCASKLKNPFFWEIEKDGKQSYLLGTVHQEIEISELPNFVMERFDKSQGVGVEIVEEFLLRPQEEVIKERHEQMSARYEYNRKHHLKASRFFTADEWRQMQAYVKTTGLKTEYAPVEYFAILISADRGQLPMGFGYYGNGAHLDHEVFVRAVKAKKLLYRLDDKSRMSDECLDLLDARAVKTMLNPKYDESQSASRANAMVKAYRRGDEEYIKRMGGGETPEEKKCLLKDRNERWVQIIDEVHADRGPFFVAAGVAHFLNTDNVIDMLKARGFKVRRMTVP